jgi:hypothetical protein
MVSAAQIAADIAAGSVANDAAFLASQSPDGAKFLGEARH